MRKIHGPAHSPATAEKRHERGANVREGLRAQTQEDFIAKMNIALKEAEESEYWLELLHRTDYLTDAEMKSIFPQCNELTKLLTSIVKTAKSNLPKSR